MDIEQTLHIITALAEGRDPVSGLPLPEGHLCQRPDVIRALHHAQSFVDREARRERRLQRARLSLPGNTGKAWTGEEDRVLVQRFRSGATIADMATLHARTTGSITARLEKLGQMQPVTPGNGSTRASQRRPYDA